MNNKKVELAFFFALLLGITVLVFFIFSPFLTELALSAIIAVAVYPLYARVLKWFRNKRTLAALAVLLAVAIVLVAPLLLVGTQIFNESRELYLALRRSETNYLHVVVDALERPVQRFSPDFSIDLRAFGDAMSDWVTRHIGSVLSGTLQVVASFVLVVIALFFFLRDGKAMGSVIVSLSPLEDSYDKAILEKLSATINSVLRGTLAVAVIQGLLVGVGLALFGVPNATLWGSVAALAALIPGLGTSLVLIPSILYLYLTGSVVPAVGLLVWGVVVVGLVDNVLVPYFYGKGIQVHPLFVLFAVLGGLAFFGPVGFLFGPIALSLFIALLDIYQSFIAGKTNQNMHTESV